MKQPKDMTRKETEQEIKGLSDMIDKAECYSTKDLIRREQLEAELQTKKDTQKWVEVDAEKCALDGPYECPACGGYIMLDGTYLDQVQIEVPCPYCQADLYVEDEEQDTQKLPCPECGTLVEFPADLEDIADVDRLCNQCSKEEERRDEKRGLYPDRADVAN